MGTPDFAVPALRSLHERAAENGWQVVAVASQPDRPAGRGGKVVAGPLKELATSLGLVVIQPASLRKSPAALEEIRNLAPDLIVVAAYGLILPKSVLEIPTFGCINVHASLLPAYRGASPISTAILDGLSTTGVSIMLMDQGMDTGPVLAQASQPILPDDTTLSLSDRLAAQGADLLLGTLPGWLQGEIAPIAQDELPGKASICRMIDKEDGLIDWRAPASLIERMVRAYTPWPGAYTTWRGQSFRIVQAGVLSGSAQPAAVVRMGKEIAVGTGDQLLVLRVVQPAGKKLLPVRDFVNGASDFIGASLG